MPDIAIVYVFPNESYTDHALRFLKTYHDCPAGLDHRTIIVTQGGPASEETQFMFASLPNCEFFIHDNSGYDIGAFQHVARDTQCDILVFFGATSYFKAPGWAIRVADSFAKHGDTMYGVMGNRGHKAVGVYPHIRTTGFWISPALFRQYPETCARPEQRYPIEHGPNCITSWIKHRGKIPWIVAMDGEYTEGGWDNIRNGFHSGTQENMLFGDRLTR